MKLRIFLIIAAAISLSGCLERVRIFRVNGGYYVGAEIPIGVESTSK